MATHCQIDSEVQSPTGEVRQIALRFGVIPNHFTRHSFLWIFVTACTFFFSTATTMATSSWIAKDLGKHYCNINETSDFPVYLIRPEGITYISKAIEMKTVSFPEYLKNKITSGAFVCGPIPDKTFWSSWLLFNDEPREIFLLPKLKAAKD